MKALLAAAAIAALWAGSVSSLVQAAPIIDQQQTQFNAFAGFLTGGTDVAQTFTVGLAGRLDSISIVAVNGGGGPIGLDLLETLAGVPTTTVIANVVIPITSGNISWITFDFSIADVNVNPGQVLAFQPIVSGSNGEVVGAEITGPGPGSFPVGPDPYPGGAMFYRQFPCPGQSCPPLTGGAWAPFTGMSPGNFNDADMTFVTTVSPVPEPSTLGLIGIGLLGLGAMRRRQCS
jgi:hypothetical protein